MAKQTKQFDLQLLLMTAMMMAIIMVLTYAVRVPAVATRGYVHLGDSAIFLAVLLLGWRYGAVAAAFGSALSDLLGGYAYFAPLTFVVKAIMAAVLGLFMERAFHKERSAGASVFVSGLGMVLAGIIEVGGYYLGEAIMYGNWAVPFTEVPLNVMQFVIATAIALPMAASLCKTPFKKYFAYKVTDSGKNKQEQSAK